jgi:hypothetical protein
MFASDHRGKIIDRRAPISNLDLDLDIHMNSLELEVRSGSEASISDQAAKRLPGGGIQCNPLSPGFGVPVHLESPKAAPEPDQEVLSEVIDRTAHCEAASNLPNTAAAIARQLLQFQKHMANMAVHSMF